MHLGCRYYQPDALHVSRVYPRGGPKAGGTAVTVWGTGFAELDEGGLQCMFGDAAPAPASLASAGGEGAQQLICTSPPLDAERCQTVTVRVTNNGNTPAGSALTSDDVGFTYYQT